MTDDAVLDWVLLAGGPSVRDALAALAPTMLSEVVIAYTVATDVGEPEAPMSPSALAWGLAPPSDYLDTLAIALASDVRPRLATRGVTID